MEKWSNPGPEKKKIQDESTTNILQNHQGNANIYIYSIYIYINIYIYKCYIYIYVEEHKRASSGQNNNSLNNRTNSDGTGL